MNKVYSFCTYIFLLITAIATVSLHAVVVDISARVTGCGDNVIDVSELCDGTAPYIQTCTSLGFSGGSLSCANTCTFNTSLCVLNPVASPSGGGGSSSSGGGGASSNNNLQNNNQNNIIKSLNPNDADAAIVIVPTVANKDKQIPCTEPVSILKPVNLTRLSFNSKRDVMVVQKFLNTYEGANLEVDGVYKKVDFDAIVKWQEKYANLILKPWGLKKGSGYVYTSSINQMKRQHKAVCSGAAASDPIPYDDALKITCPYFKTYHDTGSKGFEVEKIQEFLNREVSAGLDVDGMYDFETKFAVKLFQKKYAKEILSIWNLRIPSGWWYKGTVKKANQLLGCEL